MRMKLFALPLLLLLIGLAASPLAAQAYKVEKVNLSPPEELASAVREALAGEALRVTGPKGVLCELWLRKAIPAKPAAAQDVAIAYGQLAEGTLVAAVRFPAEVRDYRRQKIKPGVYTLRYALVPTDGNHMGVAPQRDFLLASPAAADTALAGISRDAALNLARKTTGTTHPSVWSLAAPESAAAPPAIAHQEDADLWIVRFNASLQGGTAASASVPMALVVVGFAPEA